MKLLERILAYLLNRESIALSNKLDDKVNEVYKVKENIEQAETDILNWKEKLKSLDKEMNDITKQIRKVEEVF